MTIWTNVGIEFQTRDPWGHPILPWLYGALSHEKFNTYEPWLVEQLGVEGENWIRNYLEFTIIGIYFKDAEVATAFKLRFGL